MVHVAETLTILTIILTITSTGVRTNATFGGCLPYNKSCAVCYDALKESLLKRDDNVRKLSETFFPPRGNLPEFVTVKYYIGDNDTSPEVWFWTHDSSYLFFPLQTFQYLSLYFGKPATLFARQINLTLDAECLGAQHSICLLYTSPSPRDATLSRMPSSA